MEYEIRYVHGHVEVYDQFGRFRFSADTEREALADLREEIAA
ncbi:hypothetical protein [Lawsonibacter celer]|nr:hypothetical protein [Lawsonibacter celer]